MNRKNRLSILLLLACVVCTQLLQAADPELNLIRPRGGQQGSSINVDFYGDRLEDVVEIYSYDGSLTFSDIEVVNNKRLKARMTIAEDSELGEHLIRVRTKTGITDLTTFWVSQFPNEREQEPNDDFDAPQTLPLNSTINGVADQEDVDYYVVEAKKGQRLSAEVEAMRLGRNMFDPYVAILNSKRFELNANDDTALLLQDTYASIVVPEDGKYIVEVRETSYDGRGSYDYRVHVGSFLRPAVTYPLGGKPGETVEFTFIGDPGGDFTREIKLPDQPAEKFPLRAELDGLVSPAPNHVRVSPLDNHFEEEPNNNRGQATDTAAALPLAFNGIISEEGDQDWFKFTAKKGQNLDLKVFAREMGSPLDSVINVFAADGKHLEGNDDKDNPDSVLSFRFPDDGEYFIRVRDHLHKGGPDYVYRVETVPSERSLDLYIPRFSRRDTQSRQMFGIPRGNRMATVVNIERDNLRGDVTFESLGLPEGVTFESVTMPGNVKSMPVVWQAAADAPVDGKLTDFRVIHEEGDQRTVGDYLQSLELVTGAPNNTVYYGTTAPKLPIAVVEEVPFSIEIEEPKAPLVQNGAIDLKIVAHRKEGFDENIRVRMLWKPPGIGCPTTINIGKGQTEATYTLNANGNAPTQTWHIAVVGESNAGQGEILASSGLTPLTVAPPYLTVNLEMAATEQGKETQMLCKLETTTPFEGKARAILSGLPAKIESQELEFDKDTKQIVFPIKTEKDTPPGRHKQVFCHIKVPVNGTLVAHNLGQATLRVDRPPPPKKDEPKPKKEEKPKEVVKKEPEKAPEKPLSRLEQLRQQALGSGG